ncbi:mis18-binding protein 1-like isoform X1 [Chenopodium quinoa]|uniref:mis18-binding protein 1-like isoform X1 n=1 Tax=Chenopodium quinoa TaxID=63459 RepID=UPI000B785323|nr:mis18-binding protein 1-like isoform X1 [Chenopodium quinoa]
MEVPFSPIFHKVAGEVVGKPKRTFTRPTEICLEEWWLSKLDDGKGLAVSGRPLETRKCDTPQRKFHSAPAKRRASREFHSSKIVKRHGCTTLETSDGFIVSLCGFINKSRTQQNGFSSEVCRDFNFGFPYNWEDYAASVDKDLSQINPKNVTECVLPAALESYNGAQLHDMVLSLSDAERGKFNKKVYDNLIGLLAPHSMDVIEVKPSKSTTQAGADVLNSESQRTEASNKRVTRSQTSSKQESHIKRKEASSKRVTRSQTSSKQESHIKRSPE